MDPSGTESMQSGTASLKSSQGEDNDRKRAAAKRLIQRYYNQLTKGCGRTDCINIYCASSTRFSFGHIAANAAATKAIELANNRSKLCEEVSSPEIETIQLSMTGSSSNTGERISGVSTAWPASGDISAHHNVETVSAMDYDVITRSTKASRLKCFDSSSSDSETFGMSNMSHKIPLKLTERDLITVIESCKQACTNDVHSPWAKLIHLIGEIFIEPEALMNSFLYETVEEKSAKTVPSKEDLRAMEVDQDKDQDDQEVSDDLERNFDEEDDDTYDCNDSEVEMVSSNSFFESSEGRLKSLKDKLNITVDLDSVRRSFDRLFSIPELPFQAALINAITYLSRCLETDLRSYNYYMSNPNYINIYLILMEIPQLDSLEFLDSATPQLCKTFGLLPVELQAKLARVWAAYDADRLRAMVQRLQQLITVRIIMSTWSRSNLVNDDDVITSAAKILKIMFYASLYGGEMDPPEILAEEKALKEEVNGSLEQMLQGAISLDFKERQKPYEDPLGRALGGISAFDCRRPLVDASEFVNESLSDALEMDKDYTNYKAEPSSGKFTFMLHSFLLTTAVKNMGMYYDNRIRMISERRTSLFHSMMQGNLVMPYLRLRIRRDHIIDDSLVNLEMIAMDNPQDLKKQLFVEFEGEQGIDEGGVSKEFFQLVVEEIFNPDIGMFTYNEETRTFWFNSTSFENDGQFMLIGIVLGLAIYNNIILDIHFPMVVYQKLMGKIGVFADLDSSHPVVAKSLKEFLEYEGDVVEAFAQPFAVGLSDVFGNSNVHVLKENGYETIVTNETRREFVDLYANFLLNKSVEKQFRAFQRGFHMVTDESPLALLFNPREIELLVCGCQNFDFKALEKAAEYDGGFTADSTTIKNFWDIFHEMTDEQKRHLLQFATGSDRVPIGGLSKLKLIIARNGPDSDRLPTSHTCFNVLLLPDYRTKEKLRERLLKAITYSKGFGML